MTSASSMEMKKDDKFFTRIMSKDMSIANSSCRVYYGDASSSIPFNWETRPGTPKHTFSDSSVPPLTPPPPYFSTSKSKSKSHKRINLFTNIFPKRLISHKKTTTTTVAAATTTTRVSPSSSMSSTTTSSSSSSWSSFYSSPSISMHSNSGNRSFFSCSRSPIHFRVDDYDNEVDSRDGYGSSSSILMCYGGRSSNKGLNNVLGSSYLMGNMKNAFLSILRHGSK